jgi:hypothetical protein
VPGGKGGKAKMEGEAVKVLNDFYAKHRAEQKDIDLQFDALRKEAIRMGIVKAD